MKSNEIIYNCKVMKVDKFRYMLPYLFGYFPLSRMTTNNLISSIRICYNMNYYYEYESYKTDLDFWDCFGRKILGPSCSKHC